MKTLITKDEIDAIIERKDEELRICHSFIANFIDNWNYLRGVLSWINDEDYDSEYPDDTSVFDGVDVNSFIDAKRFSEDFAMNTFREWLDLPKVKYKISNLDEHEEFKNIYWQHLEKVRKA